MVNRADEIRIPSGRIVKLAALIVAAITLGTAIGATFWKLDLEKRVEEKVLIQAKPMQEKIAQISATLDTVSRKVDFNMRVQNRANPEAYRAVIEEERMMSGQRWK